MKALILAAGLGKRLMPLTMDRPKCMVEYHNKKLIDYQINALSDPNIKEICGVVGYKAEILKEYLFSKGLSTFYYNPEYNVSNMVYSLYMAAQYINDCINSKDDLIISYSDIVYTADAVSKLVNSNGLLNIVADKSWLELWRRRFNDPLSDAESFVVIGGKIKELGKKTTTYSRIHGQYIGLFKISYSFLPKVNDLLNSIFDDTTNLAREKMNMYMTDFIQLLIDKYDCAEPVYINGNWCEIDSISDLSIDI